MHRALTLLVDLNPSDADHLLSAGLEREVHREDVIIQGGEVSGSLYVILEGVVSVESTPAGHELARLGPGELLGEIAWLDGQPASSTVRAIEDGVLLELPFTELDRMIEANPRFGVTFQRAVGRCVAQRLRAQNAQHAAVESVSDPKRGGDSPAWDKIAPMLESFKDLMVRAEHETSRRGGPPSAELMEQTRDGLGALSLLLKEELGQAAGISEEVRAEVGARARRELHPYLMLTRIVERIYSKPRGYAGDFLTIEWMYRNEPGGTGAAGPLIDAAFLERPAAKAVRNRRHLLADEISRAVERGGAVMSLACGPAEELFDVFEQTDRLKATCVDIDLQALALVSERRDRAGLKRDMRLEQGNLVYLATGRAQLEVEPLDLAYSIGLIDYFEDRFVIALLDWIHDKLKPGGRVVLGNFHPQNPDRELMDHILDWKLLHRTEEDMNRLFEQSKFKAPCSDIRYEETGVNLFAAGHRS